MQPEYFDGIDCVERNFDPIRGLSKCRNTVFGMLFDFPYSIPLMTPETPLLNPSETSTLVINIARAPIAIFSSRTRGESSLVVS